MTHPLTDEELAEVRVRWDAFLPYDGGQGPACLGCGVPTGQQHEEGCDWERCPHCGEQSFVCGNCQPETARDAFLRLLATLDAERARVAVLERVVETVHVLVDHMEQPPMGAGPMPHRTAVLMLAMREALAAIQPPT